LKSIEPNLQHTLKVWWAMAWRLSIVFFGSALIIGGIVWAQKTLLSGVLSDSQNEVFSFFLTATLYLFVTLIPVRMVLGKDFGNFRLECVEANSELDESISPIREEVLAEHVSVDEAA
jgi:hypothetical protein